MDNRWLHRFALLTALATLGLVGLGGLVTSHGVGMAVPDWPNTYGYNMFLFPVSQWVGGIFYEHSHRLLAALVGLLTTILAVWLWANETRGRARWLGIGALSLVLVLMGVRQLPVYLTLAGLAPVAVVWSLYQIRRTPGSLRWWGIIAYAAVILQGVLGGLRVVWLQDQLGIFHAALAQLFFVLTCALALATSKWWREGRAGVCRPPPKAPEDWRTPKAGASSHGRRGREAFWSAAVLCRFGTSSTGRRGFGTKFGSTSRLRWMILGTTIVILGQLVLGAVMRHQHAGLAIPDFPLAYGRLWPAMDPDSVVRYNQQRMEVTAVNPITGLQIGLQMAHRLLAVVILAAVAGCAWLARRQLGPGHILRSLTASWVGLVLVQALLGAATVWSNKAADIATGHVLVGALSLALGGMSYMISSHGLGLARRRASLPVSASAWPRGSLGTQPSPATGLNNI